jgi:hypothetical protein
VLDPFNLWGPSPYCPLVVAFTLSPKALIHINFCYTLQLNLALERPDLYQITRNQAELYFNSIVSLLYPLNSTRSVTCGEFGFSVLEGIGDDFLAGAPALTTITMGARARVKNLHKFGKFPKLIYTWKNHFR